MTTFGSYGYVLANGDGERIWFLGTLMTVKAGKAQTRGGFSLLEQTTPPGFAAPPHIHDTEEEAFYVLDGQLHVTCGEQTWTADRGSFVFLPRGIPHAFSVVGTEGANLLQITSPAGFEQFAAEAGEPATTATLPPEGEPNIPKLLAAAAKYGKRMVGTPPTP
jgi:quercetin dioxygenase-like cupin family protein